MACNPTDNQASIALLRRLRAGADDGVHFVHRVDVCTAPPEVLVADLEPVPGTDLDDDGYKKIWYFYHAKKYKNSRGDTSGHRQRAVTGGDGASWHQESRKDVEGSGGGTVCSLSYGIKTDSSAPLDRLGWCMAEYDDKKQDGAADDSSSNYVLCKVYRSPRAKGKSASASASASSSSKTKKQTAKKRKAGGGDHPEAPPAKLIQQPEPQVQQDATAYYTMPCNQHPEYVQEVAVQQPAGPGGDFNIEDFNVDEYTDILKMPRDEPEPGQPQPPTITEPEHDGRFIQLPCGPVLAATIVGDKLGAESEHEEFTVEWLLRGQPQQPIVEPPPGRAGEFIQMPFGRETMYGQWNGGMTAASIPWSSYVPTSSSRCSSLLQGPDPLRPPDLTC